MEDVKGKMEDVIDSLRCNFPTSYIIHLT